MIVSHMNYSEWIASYVEKCGGPECTYGRCKEAVQEMVSAFPELRAVPGHVEGSTKPLVVR